MESEGVEIGRVPATSFTTFQVPTLTADPHVAEAAAALAELECGPAVMTQTVR
jgi:hypothetical protein